MRAADADGQRMIFRERALRLERGEHGRLRELGVSEGLCKTGWDATQILCASEDPAGFEQRKMAEIRATANGGLLTGIAKDGALARLVLPADVYQRLIEAGKCRRSALAG